MFSDLFKYVRNGDIEKVRSLIEPGLINCKEDGVGLLHVAIVFKHDAVAMELMDLGVDINMQDKEGKTPLSYAATYQNRVVVEKLITLNADLNCTDSFGNGPLWCALQSSRKDYNLFEKLLECGANPLQENKADRSVDFFAKKTNNSLLMSILWKYRR